MSRADDIYSLLSHIATIADIACDRTDCRKAIEQFCRIEELAEEAITLLAELEKTT